MRHSCRFFLVCFFTAALSLACASHRISGQAFDISRIDEILVGMTQEEVLSILGPPFIEESYIGGTKWIWSFSTRNNDHSFAVRIEYGRVQSRSEYVQEN